MCDQAVMKTKFEQLVAANTWPALHPKTLCPGCLADERYIFAAMNAFCLAQGDHRPTASGAKRSAQGDDDMGKRAQEMLGDPR